MIEMLGQDCLAQAGVPQLKKGKNQVVLTFSAQPDENGDKEQEAEETSIKLIKTGEDPPEKLDLVHETLGQMAFLVNVLIIVTRLPAIRAGRDNRRRPTRKNALDKVVRIIRPVGNDVLTHKIGQQIVGLGDVMALPAGQPETQRVIQGIHTYVDFGAEAAPAASQSLHRLSAVFFGRACRARRRSPACLALRRATVKPEQRVNKMPCPSPMIVAVFKAFDV